MPIREYFQRIEEIISGFPAITSREITFEQRTRHIGLVKGVLTFHDSSELHFKEFVDVGNKITKYKYAYHYQKNKQLIFRYDNHPFPFKKVPQHHKHYLTEENILESHTPDLGKILKEILLHLP